MVICSCVRSNWNDGNCVTFRPKVRTRERERENVACKQLIISTIPFYVGRTHKMVEFLYYGSIKKTNEYELRLTKRTSEQCHIDSC
jgi:hypothetical protein